MRFFKLLDVGQTLSHPSFGDERDGLKRGRQVDGSRPPFRFTGSFLIRLDNVAGTVAKVRASRIYSSATCRSIKGRKALCGGGFRVFHRKKPWCRGPDLNRQAVKRRIFVTPRLSTPTTPGGILVRALDYAFTIAVVLLTALGAPRLVSTPSTPSHSCDGGLGSALPRSRAERKNQGVHRI